MILYHMDHMHHKTHHMDHTSHHMDHKTHHKLIYFQELGFDVREKSPQNTFEEYKNHLEHLKTTPFVSMNEAPFGVIRRKIKYGDHPDTINQSEVYMIHIMCFVIYIMCFMMCFVLK